MTPRLSLVLPAVLLCACAPEIVRRESPMSPAPGDGTAYTVVSSASVRLDSGYSRTLQEGTRLVEAGSIAEGRVLKPTNHVFTVEGAHMHEAWLVERDGRLVGFYLPAERAFSPLSQEVKIQLHGETRK